MLISPTSGHSKSIDGLRAFAILPVLLGHAFPFALPGGFIGVDIFFVISGFLITGMIVRNMRNGTFDWLDFYKRRVLRIFPALFSTLLITFAAALIILPPMELREMGQAMTASSVFLSNILFWLKSGYFDAAAEANPLVHTWSLAVEEQFYIVAPILAFLVAWRKGALLIFLAVIGVLSFSFATMTNEIVPSTWFYFTINRIFELVIGCLAGATVAMMPDRVRALGSDTLAIAASAVALAALFWSYFNFGAESHHPGALTLIPVCATAVLLILHDRNTIVQRFLQFGPFVAIGLVSYSLYLVHQPIIALIRVVSFGEPGPVNLSVALVGAIVLAWVFWRFIEQPFRKYDKFSLRQTFSLGTAAMALVAMTGLALYFSDGLPQRYSSSVRSLANPETSFTSEVTITAGPAIALWGDSHAKMLLGPIQNLTESGGTESKLYTLGGCPPIPGFDNEWRNLEGPGCASHNAKVFDLLLNLPEATTIVVAARWANYLRPPSHYDDFGKAVSLASRSIFPAHQSIWTDDVSESAASSLREAFTALASQGHNVIVMGSVPVQPYNAVSTAYLLQGEEERIREISLNLASFKRHNAVAQKVLTDATVDLVGVALREVSEVMCGPEKCSMLGDKKIIYTDNNHLNQWGAIPVLQYLFTGTAH